MQLGVIIGRFQVPDLHEGHKKLIEHVLKEHGQVLILIGCSAVLGSKRYPLDYMSRERMIKEAFPDVMVAPLADMQTDEAWTQQVDGMVNLMCPLGRVVLYGGRDSFIPHYKGRYKTFEIELELAPSGTDVRQVSANRLRVSSDFRAGVIYALTNQYQRVFPTVDIAIVKGSQVLLGKKPNENVWRFPGGFTDQKDDSQEVAAIREAEEETGIKVGKLNYVCSHRAADWRYKTPDDGFIMTHFFVTQEWEGQPKAGDDLAQVMWFEMNDISKAQIVSTHKHLFDRLMKYMNSFPQGVMA